MIILIPAYEPNAGLVALTRSLLEADQDLEIVIVDDGSGPAFAAVFDDARRAGAHLLVHEINRGKGAALKTGFAEILDRWPAEDVVTADADGQHTPGDIARIGDELRADAAAGRTALILGCRSFTGDVPLRSRVGNSLSRAVFRAAAGWRASDTQTGLRGIPAPLLPWLLEVPGDRFEYETEMLLRLRRDGHDAREIPIDTVYLHQNASSHFRPIVDSLRVSLPLLLFTGSSLLAFLIDTAALLLLAWILSPWMPGWLAASIITARVLSASVNFAVNRRIVFRRGGRAHAVRHALRYALLAGALLASNIVWIEGLTRMGLPLIVAKILTEVVLFITSYQVQRQFVFGRGSGQSAPQETEAEALTASKEAHRDRIVPAIRMDDDTHRLERTP